MAEVTTTIDNPHGQTAVKPSDTAATISRNVVASLGRVAVNSVVALVLPAFLTHHLPLATYGAWVLILQLGAYVSFLDFGIQTGVAKFVSEYEARGDEKTAGRYASAGLAIMVLAGLLGVALTFGLVWQVPRLFHNMPSALYHDVRVSVVLVGSSLSLGLVCSVFSAIFLGLQRYSVAMAIGIANRLAFTIVVLVSVLLHGSLAAMGAGAAIVNVATALLQIVAWHKLAARIRISLTSIDSAIFKQMTRYCSLMAIWTVGMLLVSGMDVTIVGHYDYLQTAYYSVASLPTNFMLLICSALLGPVLPAASALSTHRSASEMGAIVSRTTRYSTTLLLLTGLPLMVCGEPILRLWVGPVYAFHCLTYLRILILANVLRNLCAPYSTFVVATNRQGAATAAAISEAGVNLGSSILLAKHFGAIGVALGTLIGAFVGVSLHFAVTMHFTQEALTIPRMRLFLIGLLRPALMGIPSLVLLPFWWSPSRKMLSPTVTTLWAFSTLTIAWFVNLSADDRSRLKHLIRSRLAPLAAAG